MVTDLTKVLADITDYHLQHTAINSSEFNHELFVEALTLSQQGKSDGAIQLLKSLIIIEPNNIPAYKILINWLQYKGDFASALVLSTQAIARMKENEPDKTSIYYRHGYNLLKLHKIDQAWHFSKLIKQQLKTEINPFYHGLSSQLEGELYVEQQDYKNAKVAFNQSLKQFEAISFSIGMTSLHCLLAKIEANLGDHKASEKQLELARKVVSQYEIESLLPLFKIELTM